MVERRLASGGPTTMCPTPDRLSLLTVAIPISKGVSDYQLQAIRTLKRMSADQGRSGVKESSSRPATAVGRLPSPAAVSRLASGSGQASHSSVRVPIARSRHGASPHIRQEGRPALRWQAKVISASDSSGSEISGRTDPALPVGLRGTPFLTRRPEVLRPAPSSRRHTPRHPADRAEHRASVNRWRPSPSRGMLST
jgi:hypothetical protein